MSDEIINLRKARKRRALKKPPAQGLRKSRIETWRTKNREAIIEANAELAANGLWSDGLRLF